ncbi:cancer-associated protein 1 protein-like [Platysternon megacephalum]|uniref:Cancer-associated protein 1 protein-like n=1 Tax=Platysternon megacephalum TaxID=55544 RepID=A0A4D9EQU5_9SAUR|nr:cancer-associated protein 1 protein-like [Platysternon megacephalum]
MESMQNNNNRINIILCWKVSMRLKVISQRWSRRRVYPSRPSHAPQNNGIQNASSISIVSREELCWVILPSSICQNFEQMHFFGLRNLPLREAVDIAPSLERPRSARPVKPCCQQGGEGKHQVDLQPFQWHKTSVPMVQCLQ